jgi:hypothetical protein
MPQAIQRKPELSVLHLNYVVFPTVFEDILRIIEFALSQSLSTGVKGGRRNTATRASTEGGLVIDLGEVDTAQGGA